MRPTQLANTQAITAMAAGPDDQLAIATTNSNSVQILDTATGSFSQIGLRSGTEATDVAYDSDGTLGIAETLYSGTTTSGSLLIVHPDGTETSVPDFHSINLAATGSGFVANDTQKTVAESGSAETSSAPTATGTVGGSPTSAEAGGWSVVVGNDTIYSAAGGIVVNSTDGSMSVIHLPTFECIGVGGTDPIGQTSVPTTTAVTTPPECPEQVLALAANEKGVFAVLSAPLPTVVFLPSSDYQ
jgi:hypothetical protein